MLRGAGNLLVVRPAVTTADVIVVGVGAGGAAVLEVSDLVAQRIASRVAVFADPPAPEDLEFVRRGVPYYDMARFSVTQLHALGVRDVGIIPRAVSGTEEVGTVLPAWAQERGYRSVIIVTTADHSRRLQRVLRRVGGGSVQFTVIPSRYSGFAPDTWWHSRNGVRTAIVESQKLLLDVLRHPFS